MHSLTDRPTDGPPTIPQYVRQKDAELNAKETDQRFEAETTTRKLLITDETEKSDK